MKEPFYPEGFELFECPSCRASHVKYRYDFEPKTGDVVHWGECDFSMCHAHFELHYPEEVPSNPFSLLVVEEKPKRTDISDRILTAEEKIAFFHELIEKDKHEFPSKTRDDLIAYILCLDLFLRQKKEFNASITLKMRWGVGW